MNRFTKKDLFLPLKIIVVYLIFTLLLYEFGPFKWVTYKPVLFWGLNIIYILMLVFGWGIGTKQSSCQAEWNEENHNVIVRRLKYLITLEFIFEYLIAIRRFSLMSLSPLGLLRSIFNGLQNMGGAYNNFQDSVNLTGGAMIGGSAVTFFNIIFSFVGFNILLLSILYFKYLSIYNRILTVSTLSLVILEYLSTGTNIGIFRIILAFLVFYGLKIVRERRSIHFFKSNNNKFLIMFIIGIIICTVIFDKIMQSRGGILFWQSPSYNIGGIGIDRDSILFRILPSGLYMLLIAASSYISQGYYGMSLCLRLPWKPGYGVGHSMCLLDLLGDFFSVSHENSYQYRVTTFGWQEGNQWHTMYSWFANDVTFIGVILIMVIIGILFSMAYKDSLLTNSPYAKLIVFYYSLLAFFIPCNNQLFQSSYIMFSFFTALIFWLATRGRKRIKITIGYKKL